MPSMRGFAPRCRFVNILVSSGVVLALCGCDQFWINSADRIANRIIEQRQQQTLGTNSNFRLSQEDGDTTGRDQMYSFVPHPIDSAVPEAFLRPAPSHTAEEKAAGNDGVSDANTTGVRPLHLSESLAYAFQHAWDFQTQKEDLYLAALTLMTERQLWTPQVIGEIRGQYANFGQERNFDQAMNAVAELSATQRLPYGGQISAQVINSLMRDIGRHTTSGESGQTILEANIPLLKGAGRVAYESRYQAERDLIYAVRAFERNRRILVVNVASDFFGLLSTKAQIDSAEAALKSAEYELDRASAKHEIGEILDIEVDRSHVNLLAQQNTLIAARVRYQQSLDRFKIRLGMSTSERVDAVDDEMDLFEPDVTRKEAIQTALAYRLDLLSTLDRVDDSGRQVRISANNFLPQFDFTGRVSTRTDPARKNSFSYNSERTLWQGFLSLELPIDRREERNIFRASIINFRRAERDYALAVENVRLDVRNAIRNLHLARETMAIQEESVKVNKSREISVRTRTKFGEISSTRDQVEAQDDLRRARNQYAAAVAGYRISILELLRDCGMLRVGDDGRWVRESPHNSPE